jgi:hypothetical protein
MTTFDEIVTEARRCNPDWTDAEWDYSLAFPDGRRNGLAELGNAAYIVANKHLPEITADGPSDLTEREANADALIRATAAERVALIAAARAKQYGGWSDESRALGKRITYV